MTSNRPVRPLGIYAADGVAWRIDSELPSLRDAVKELFGASIRRVNRLIQLALVGAGRCARGFGLDRRCGLYLASGQGALQDSVDVFTQMFIDAQPPKPISFVNTLGNTACFYVAKCLGLSGPNQFVSASALPFESALSLAVLDLERGLIDHALVGGVDECVLPLADHRKRLRTRADAPLGEGSHWLLLGRDRPWNALGELVDVRELRDRDSLAEWIARFDSDTETCHFACGSGIDSALRAWLVPQLKGFAELDYTPRAAYYETVSAAGICGFLRGGSDQDPRPPTQRSTATLVHINASADGRFAICVVRRTG